MNGMPLKPNSQKFVSFEYKKKLVYYPAYHEKWGERPSPNRDLQEVLQTIPVPLQGCVNNLISFEIE
jgi:hypothetical protein